MDTLSCIEKRRSVRSYTDKPVERETIKRLVSAAQLAPSWKNTQTTRFTAITNKDTLNEICATLGDWNQKIVSNAPLLLVVSAITGHSGYGSSGNPTIYGEGYTFFDCGTSVENLCLAATDLGIGTVILGLFDPQKLKEIAKVPDGEEVLVLIACGYYENDPPANTRLPIEDVLRFV